MNFNLVCWKKLGNAAQFSRYLGQATKGCLQPFDYVCIIVAGPHGHVVRTIAATRDLRGHILVKHLGCEDTPIMSKLRPPLHIWHELEVIMRGPLMYVPELIQTNKETEK